MSESEKGEARFRLNKEHSKLKGAVWSYPYIEINRVKFFAKGWRILNESFLQFAGPVKLVDPEPARAHVQDEELVIKYGRRRHQQWGFIDIAEHKCAAASQHRRIEAGQMKRIYLSPRRN